VRPVRFETVVMHELGQVLGLGHRADPTSVIDATLGAGAADRNLAATAAPLTLNQNLGLMASTWRWRICHGQGSPGRSESGCDQERTARVVRVGDAPRDLTSGGGTVRGRSSGRIESRPFPAPW
jgi:hypothetical protein